MTKDGNNNKELKEFLGIEIRNLEPSVITIKN